MKSQPAVWVIDDDQSVIEQIEEVFAKILPTHQVITFTDVPTFLSAIHWASTLPLLLFVDYRLFDTDGLQVIGRLKEKPATSNLTMILFSKIIPPDIAYKAEQLGVYRVLVKPLDVEDWYGFIDTLRREGVLDSKPPNL